MVPESDTGGAMGFLNGTHVSNYKCSVSFMTLAVVTSLMKGKGKKKKTVIDLCLPNTRHCHFPHLLLYRTTRRKKLFSC